MSLEKWAEFGWLKAEPTSRDEIKGLLTIVNRDLKDAHVVAISEDRRFEAAFSAARTTATIALRASGYRTSSQAGHHVKTIESLELTIAADSRLVQRLKTLSKKRNATQLQFSRECFGAGIGISNQERCRAATHGCRLAGEAPSQAVERLNGFAPILLLAGWGFLVRCKREGARTKIPTRANPAPMGHPIRAFYRKHEVV